MKQSIRHVEVDDALPINELSFQLDYEGNIHQKN